VIRSKKQSVANPNAFKELLAQKTVSDLPRPRAPVRKETDGSLAQPPLQRKKTAGNQASLRQSYNQSSVISYQASKPARLANRSQVRHQTSVFKGAVSSQPLTTKSNQAGLSLPGTTKNSSSKASQNFLKDLLECERDKFGDRSPFGFKKLSLLGKGGIALVWLMQVNTEKLGPELLGQKVALKQFPKTKTHPLDTSAYSEIETGNCIFPLQVKDGFEGDNDDEFERGYALDPEEFPGI
jgi:hypothetical protein